MQTFETLANRLRSSTVQLKNRRGGGSGVVWDAEGTIVTNAHVIRSAEATVVFPSGEEVRGKVVRRDDHRDLAVLTTRPGMAPAAEIGDSSKLRVGEMVMAVGNPLGFIGAVSAGMIHAVGPLGEGPRREWVQADVRLAPGNSGGMLANAAGQVIGINTMIVRGLGLAVPSNEAGEFVRGESIDPVRLGVEMIPAREGLVVVRIAPGSLAERARVVIGDVIQCSTEELRRLLSEVTRSGTSEIPMLHGGKPKMLRVSKSREATVKEDKAA